VVELDLISNYLRLYSKWNEIKRDKYYVRDYLSKHPDELRKHLEEVEAYEDELLKTPLPEEEKGILLARVRDYKKDLTNSPSGYALNDPFPILFFLTALSLGAVSVLAGEVYAEKSKRVKEKGLREGFAKKLEEILRRRGNEQV